MRPLWGAKRNKVFTRYQLFLKFLFRHFLPHLRIYFLFCFFFPQNPKQNLLAMAVGIKQKESVNKILKKVNHRDCLLVMKQVWCDIHLPFVAVLIKWVCRYAVPLWWHRRWMEGVWVEWNCYSCFCCKPNQVVTIFSDSWIWYNSIWLYNFVFFLNSC